MTGRGRVVRLRSGEDDRYLDAWCDTTGALHINGQDFGPAAAIVWPRGEYEWFHTSAADEVPQVLALLDASPTTDILDVLEDGWCGDLASELETRLRNSDITVKRHVI